METPEWHEPGCYEVADGVFRIPLPLPNDALKAVNTYVIVDDNRLVMVDSGQYLEVAMRALKAGLSHLGAEFGDIERFLITHIHRDHYTQAVPLRREYGMKISLGSIEKESLGHAQTRTGNPLTSQFEVIERAGAKALLSKLLKEPNEEGISGQLYEPPDDWLNEGQVLDLATRRLRVIHTPGHTMGHVVFDDPENGLLFSGDHILPHITPSIGFEPVVTDNPLGSFLSSLRRVRRLRDARLLPAHGDVLPGFHGRIDELINHHDIRLGESLAALGTGAATVWDVASELTWTRRRRLLHELDPFNQMLAVMETKFHLDLLVAQERAQLDDSGELYLYSLPNDKRR